METHLLVLFIYLILSIIPVQLMEDHQSPNSY